jgi:hypothetical protein
MSDPRPDPSLDPDERQLARRSNNPAISPWLVVLGIALVGAVVYVASALI